MNYVDSDVLIHSLVNQDLNLHLKVNDMMERMIADKLSHIMVEHTGNRFVLAKLDQPFPFILSKLNALMSALPVQYGPLEFNRAMELAKIIGFKNFNDCLHTAIAEQYCSDLYTCNYKDFKLLQPHTPLLIHFL